MAEAEALTPASQIVREMMRDFVKKRRDEREYVEFVRRKVEIARAQIEAGKFVSQEQIEADVAARRADLLRRSGEDAA